MMQYSQSTQSVRSWLKRTLFVLFATLGLVGGNVLVITGLAPVGASTSISFIGSSWESKGQLEPAHLASHGLAPETLLFPAVAATATVTEPDISAVSPAAFQVGENDLALLYLENNLLYRFDVAQQQSRVIAQVPPRTVMSLSPNGHYLVYNRNTGGAHLLNTLTGETSALFDPQSRFSPTVWSQHNHVMIQRFYGNSECLEVGWFDPAEKILHPYGETSGQFGCVPGAAWSNRGDRIAVGDYAVLMLEVASGKREFLVEPRPTLARTTSLDWSPDDRWVAVSLDDNNPTLPQPLYLKQPNVSGLRTVTSNQVGRAESPVWGPDSALYYGITGADTQADGIYRYSLANQISLPLVSGSVLFFQAALCKTQAFFTTDPTNHLSNGRSGHFCGLVGRARPPARLADTPTRRAC
jgi:hypothetical protein